MAVDNLTEVHGVGKITAERLRSAGISTISALADASLEELSRISGFPTARTAAVQSAARELLGSLPTAEPPAEPIAKMDKKKKLKGKKKKDKPDKKKRKRKSGKKKDKGKKDGKKNKGKKGKKGK